MKKDVSLVRSVLVDQSSLTSSKSTQYPVGRAETVRTLKNYLETP